MVKTIHLYNSFLYFFQKKGTEFALAFHPFPLFDGQAILFEKYPHIEGKIENPLENKEPNLEASKEPG